MKYNININQYAATKMGLGLDIIDLTILDCVASMMLSGNFARMVVDDVAYYWVKTSLIGEEVPLLGISTDRGINKRLDNLIDAGLLERCPENKKLNKSFLAIGGRYAEYVGVNKTADLGTKIPSTLERVFQAPWNGCSKNNNTNDNNTNDNNKPPISPNSKKVYADGVKMTEEEYGKLLAKYGSDTAGIIEYLSNYKKEKNYKTNSDYLTILRWVANAYSKKKDEEGKTKQGGFFDNYINAMRYGAVGSPEEQ